VNERLSKRHGLGGREADDQLPAQHQALLFGVKAAEATQVHGHRPPLREAVPKTADSPNESGWFLSKMVHPAAARLCTPRMAEIRHIQTSEPFMSANSAIVEHLNGLEGHLLSRIKGQDHVIPRVSECDSEQRVVERCDHGEQGVGRGQEANYEGCEQMVSEPEPDCGASARRMVVVRIPKMTDLPSAREVALQTDGEHQQQLSQLG
jgi:hypothetical protein